MQLIKQLSRGFRFIFAAVETTEAISRIKDLLILCGMSRRE